MKILNIYSLDDTKLCNVIASLSEGIHVIGRGGLLNVSDKRVSRKHAVIDISNDKVTLTSVHINPCFFKAANGRTLTVIKQNEENELNDGDHFALLPDDYWFRVKIATEPTEEELFLGDKRIVNDDNSQLQNAKNLQSLVDSNHVDENQPSTSIKIEHINTSPEQITESVLLHSQETARIETIEQVNGMEEESYLGGKRIAENDNSLLENAKKPRLSTNPNDAFDENQPSTSIKIEHVNTSHEQITESVLSHSEETAQNEDQVTSGIKEELLDYSQEQDHGYVQGAQNPQDIGENQPVTGNTTHNMQTVVKLENGEENQNGPSTSNAGPDLQQPQPRLTQRERCWYGNTCFRKNPNHRASFSHPGDPDYDPDPGDNQPECPYGTACYRKNPDHRRQYKHTNRPVPRPNSPTTDNSPGLASSPPNQQRPKRKQKNKPRGQISDDDYDYSDPFLNDGSSDDYEPSDYDSSDDENSEETESQDRKRMLHEAKKFTKHKK